jgi:hypothetical protein
MNEGGRESEGEIGGMNEGWRREKERFQSLHCSLVCALLTPHSLLSSNSF